MTGCPQCGTTNRPGARFCRECGGHLPPTPTPSATCSYCGAALRPGARFCKQCGKPVAVTTSATGARSTCSNCGKSVRSRALFCPYCGASLSRTVTTETCSRCGAPVRAMSRFCPVCGAALMTIETPVPPSRKPGRFGTGDLLPLLTLADRYVIMEKIAQGGMGAIYKAQDQRLQNKIVAVKEMSEAAIAPAERARVLEAFQREAKLLAKLQHPHLVRVSDLFQEAERYYMVMEFIEGRTLEKMLAGRTEPFPEDQVLVWAEQLCDVLTFLHSQNPKIIYRDMKPANVMVLAGSDDVKLIDFGIARFYKPGKKGDPLPFGTDGNAPPEQYGKFQTDERADVYALGVVLHQLLTLHDPVTVPFQFPRVRSLNPKVSRRVDAAIAQALQSRRDKRHQSIAELQDALVGKGAAKSPRQPAKGQKTRPGKTPPVKATAPTSTPPPVPALPVFTLPVVDFGTVALGGGASGGGAPGRSFEITLPPGEKATLSTDAPWLHVYPPTVKKRKETLTITLDTLNLKPGRLQLRGGNWLRRWAGWHTRRLIVAEQVTYANVLIELGGGQKQRAPVSVHVVPKPWQVRLGWAITIGAMLLEAAAVVGPLGALFIALVGGF